MSEIRLLCATTRTEGERRSSILERHHDTEDHARDDERNEYQDNSGERTVLGPSAFGGAEEANAFCALFGRVPCGELGGRVEVDEEEGA